MSDLVQATVDAAPQPGRGQPLYLSVDGTPVFAVAHLSLVSPSQTGVLLSPPFGWDELCTYRSMRCWAAALAADGHAALRLDLAGSGDSGGSPRDPRRLDAWTESVAAGARWLATVAGCERIVAIGIGLGGMVAVRALSGGAAIDDLVLWSVPARGTALMRELRAFARMTVEESGEVVARSENPPPESDDDGLEVGGFVISAETIADLEALNLTALTLPGAARRRVLLLGRDSLAPDRRLREYFERGGDDVIVGAGVGYGRMVTHPQFAQAPHEVFASVARWLDADAPAPTRARPTAAPPSAERAELRVDGTEIREATFEFEFGGNRLAGVLAEPLSAVPAPLCGLLLNAGAVRRIGPNRMWVECARRWAARGVPTLRLDAAGLGDSDGDGRRYQRSAQFYRDPMSEQVIAAMNELQARDRHARFLITGLCSGAYWAFHAGLQDERVRGLVLINLWPFFWSEQVAAAHDIRRARSLLRAGAWRDVARIATSDGRIGRLARMKLRSVVRTGRRDPVLASLDDAIDGALGALRERNVQTSLLLCDGEPLIEEFVADGRLERLAEWPNLRLERIPIEDHIFRPVWAQQHVHRALDHVLERTLEADATRSGAR